MRYKLYLLSLLVQVTFSCAYEDDYVPPVTDYILKEDTDFELTIDIYYVKGSDPLDYVKKFDEQLLIKDLNGKYFNRANISIKLGTINYFENDELYDLTDNRGDELSVFLNETQEHHDPNRVKMFVIKRSNIISIAGLASDNRILLTDEKLFTSTTPHEIGHILGLHHFEEEGNMMSTVRPFMRKEFNDDQILVMQDGMSFNQ